MKVPDQTSRKAASASSAIASRMAKNSFGSQGYVGCGTVFSLSAGLGPFVKTQPGGAIVGAAVDILGTNLTGATSVSFSGSTR